MIWDLAGASPPDDNLLNLLLLAGATWFLAPLNLTPQCTLLAPHLRAVFGDRLNLLLPVSTADLISRRSEPLKPRLELFQTHRCQAAVLIDATPGDIKSGTPFHRLSRLRDSGLVDWFVANADDHATAEWLLHHTPAHALMLPVGLADLTARYRLFDDARAYGTGLIARPVTEPAWNEPHTAGENWSFLASDPAISSILVPLAQAPAALRAISTPMSPAEHQEWWNRFQAAVPPPPLPQRNLPPEFG